jgi:hypothetical protein
MRKGFIAFCFILFAGTVHAQKWAFELWHDGKIVLESGDTLKGLVKYDMSQDLVQYNSNKSGSVEIYTARKVLFVEIFDNTINQYRQFYSLPYSATGNYRAPVFFELLTEGKLTLLTRENLEYRTYSSPYYFGSYTRLVLVYRFFILQEKGVITEFVGKKIDLLNLMGKRASEVEDYMKANKLKIEDRDDFAKIVSYYNSLFKT